MNMIATTDAPFPLIKRPIESVSRTARGLATGRDTASESEAVTHEPQCCNFTSTRLPSLHRDFPLQPDCAFAPSAPSRLPCTLPFVEGLIHRYGAGKCHEAPFMLLNVNLTLVSRRDAHVHTFYSYHCAPHLEHHLHFIIHHATKGDTG